MNNYNSNTTTVKIPAGLIFIPDNDSSQKLMTAISSNITLEADNSKKIKLIVYCINKTKHVEYSNYFTMDVVSNNDQVTTLLNKLNDKSESSLYEHSITIQDIIWDISNGDGLTQADIDSLNSW